MKKWNYRASKGKAKPAVPSKFKGAPKHLWHELASGITSMVSFQCYVEGFFCRGKDWKNQKASEEVSTYSVEAKVGERGIQSNL